MTKRLILAAIILAVSLAPIGSMGETKKLSNVGFYFDTVVTINAYVEDMGVINEALAECARYEALLSKTVEGSDVWNINRAEGNPVEVSDDTVSILNLVKRVSDMSSGAFDVTVAPAVALWNFKDGMQSLPDDSDVAAAAAKIDYKKITVNGNTVTLPRGMSIDLGGVAKGYIADRIAEFLRDKGVTSGILNFGGNVVSIGKKPDGEWRVGIQNPREPTGSYLIAINASDKAVVTSGIYERGFDLDGTRYHHLLDPKTGWPKQNELASVTIITDMSSLADALSTATFVLGMEKGVELVNSLPGVEAIFITRDNDIYSTDGASEMIVG